MYITMKIISHSFITYRAGRALTVMLLHLVPTLLLPVSSNAFLFSRATWSVQWILTFFSFSSPPPPLLNSVFLWHLQKFWLPIFLCCELVFVVLTFPWNLFVCFAECQGHFLQFFSPQSHLFCFKFPCHFFVCFCFWSWSKFYSHKASLDLSSDVQLIHSLLRDALLFVIILFLSSSQDNHIYE